MAKGKVKAFVNRNAKSIGKDLKKVAGFTVLLPYKLVMQKILDNRKIKYNKSDISDIAVKFYTQVLGKNLNYEKGVEHFVLTAATVAIILPAIIDFIKSIANKKKEGKPLSKEEQDVLDVAEKEAKKLNEPEKESKGLGELFSDPLVLFIAALVLFMIVKR